MIQNLLFDLDGTLTDPALGITNSVMYALEKFGIRVSDRRELYSFIGPPLIDSFIEFYGFTHEQASEALAYYREYFSVTGIFENEVYEGIPDMLETLKKEGKKIYLATSKPLLFAEKILRHFDLYKYFDGVYGASMDEKMNKKEQVIAYILEKEKIDPSTACMIGDRKFDVEGGKLFGLTTVGVTFGYGDEKELCDAGADHIAHGVAELKNILLNKIN